VVAALRHELEQARANVGPMEEGRVVATEMQQSAALLHQEASARFDSLTRQMTHLWHAVQSIHDIRASAKSANQRAAKFEQEALDLTAAHAVAEARIRARDHTIAELRATSQQAHAVMQTLATALEQVEGEAVTRSATEAALKGRVETAETAAMAAEAELQAAEAVVGALRTTLDEAHAVAEADAAALREQLAEGERKRRGLEEAVEAAHTRHAELETALSEAEAGRRELETAGVAVSGRVLQLEAMLGDATRRLQTAEVERRRLAGRVAAHREEKQAWLRRDVAAETTLACVAHAIATHVPHTASSPPPPAAAVGGAWEEEQTDVSGGGWTEPATLPRGALVEALAEHTDANPAVVEALVEAVRCEHSELAERLERAERRARTATEAAEGAEAESAAATRRYERAQRAMALADAARAAAEEETGRVSARLAEVEEAMGVAESRHAVAIASKVEEVEALLQEAQDARADAQRAEAHALMTTATHRRVAKELEHAAEETEAERVAHESTRRSLATAHEEMAELSRRVADATARAKAAEDEAAEEAAEREAVEVELCRTRGEREQARTHAIALTAQLRSPAVAPPSPPDDADTSVVSTASVAAELADEASRWRVEKGMVQASLRQLAGAVAKLSGDAVMLAGVQRARVGAQSAAVGTKETVEAAATMGLSDEMGVMRRLLAEARLGEAHVRLQLATRAADMQADLEEGRERVQALMAQLQAAQAAMAAREVGFYAHRDEAERWRGEVEALRLQLERDRKLHRTRVDALNAELFALRNQSVPDDRDERLEAMAGLVQQATGRVALLEAQVAALRDKRGGRETDVERDTHLEVIALLEAERTMLKAKLDDGQEVDAFPSLPDITAALDASPPLARNLFGSPLQQIPEDTEVTDLIDADATIALV